MVKVKLREGYEQVKELLRLRVKRRLRQGYVRVKVVLSGSLGLLTGVASWKRAGSELDKLRAASCLT